MKKAEKVAYKCIQTDWNEWNWSASVIKF